MKWKEALTKYINEKDKELHKREIGRYYCSEIWQMEKGYLTPNNYFKEKIVDIYGGENILFGNALEKEWAEVFKFNKLDFEYEPKKELFITDEIKLVVKPDFVFKSLVIEMKCPDKDMPNIIPEKWVYQLESEFMAFERPVWLGILRKHPALTLIPYKYNGKSMEKIKDILVEFDKKLKEFHEKVNWK